MADADADAPWNDDKAGSGVSIHIRLSFTLKDTSDFYALNFILRQWPHFSQVLILVVANQNDLDVKPITI